MQQIFFYKNDYLNDVVLKKYESKVLYASSLIRYSLKKNELVKVLDNSSILLHFYTKKYHSLYSLNLLSYGSSLYGQQMSLANYIDKNKTFCHFFPKVNKQISFSKKLKNLSKFNKLNLNIAQKMFIYLIPLKGGCLGLTGGFLSFLKCPKNFFLKNQKFLI